MRHAFHGLKSTSIYVSGLPPAYFDGKKQKFHIRVFYQNMMGEALRHA